MVPDDVDHHDAITGDAVGTRSLSGAPSDVEHTRVGMIGCRATQTGDETEALRRLHGLLERARVPDGMTIVEAIRAGWLCQEAGHPALTPPTKSEKPAPSVRRQP